MIHCLKSQGHHLFSCIHTIKEAEEYVLQDYKKIDAAFSTSEFDYSYEEIDELRERIEILLTVYVIIYALHNDEEYIHYDDLNVLKSLINSELHRTYKKSSMYFYVS